VYTILVGTRDKETFERTRPVCEDNIKEHKERGQEHVHWINLPSSCEYGSDIFGFVKCTRLFEILRNS